MKNAHWFEYKSVLEKLFTALIYKHPNGLTAKFLFDAIQLVHARDTQDKHTNSIVKALNKVTPAERDSTDLTHAKKDEINTLQFSLEKVNMHKFSLKLIKRTRCIHADSISTNQEN